ncbi:P2Y purinoceptor 14-like isoform X2 [Narcine bancroftii]
MNNSTIFPIKKCSDLRDPTVTKVIFPILYIFVFLGGFLLNMLAAWIFCHIPNQSSFVIYLKNIVAADLLFMLTLPFKIISDSNLGSWKVKAFVCRYSAVFFYNSMYISVIFLGLISLDRFLKIVQPRKGTCMQKGTFARVVSGGCWVFILAFALPNIILTNQVPTEKNVSSCLKLKSKVGVIWHRIVVFQSNGIFWIVLVFLTLCYLAILKKMYWSNQKFQKDSSIVIKKANRNIFSILGVFCICFVPYHFIRIPYDNSRLTSDCTTQNKLYYTKQATLLLCACNVCLDPIIYFLLCKSFTRLLRRKLKIKRSLNLTQHKAQNKPQSSHTSIPSPETSKVVVELVKANSLPFTSNVGSQKPKVHKK